MEVPSSAAVFALPAGILPGGMLGTTRDIGPVAPAPEPPGNVTPAALADRVLGLPDDEDERMRLGEGARQFAEAGMRLDAHLAGHEAVIRTAMRQYVGVPHRGDRS